MIPIATLQERMSKRKPRASGDDPPPPGPARRRGRGVNPARAGMIPGTRFPLTSPFSKPRASGDDPFVPKIVKFFGM